MAVETSGNDWRIDGNATFTIDRSRATMNAAATVTANTGHGIVGRSSCFTTPLLLRPTAPAAWDTAP